MEICEGNFNKPFHEVRSCNPSTQGAEFKTRLVYTMNLRPVWDKQDFASTPLTLTLPSPIKSHKKKKLCHNRTKERTKWRNKREPSDKNFSRKKFNCTPITNQVKGTHGKISSEKKKKRGQEAEEWRNSVSQSTGRAAGYAALCRRYRLWRYLLPTDCVFCSGERKWQLQIKRTNHLKLLAHCRWPQVVLKTAHV